MATDIATNDQASGQVAGATLTSVYFITGASRGLGLEMVRQLLSASHKNVVVAACRSPKSASALQELAARHPGRVNVIQLDTADEKSIKAAAAWVDESIDGRVDVLINNAGADEQLMKPWHSVDFSEASSLLVTNFLGPVMVTSALLPALRKGNRKTIVNLSSVLGSIGLFAQDVRETVKAVQSGAALDALTPTILPAILATSKVAYKASKTAVNMETLVMAHDLASENFTVVSIHPGWVATDMGNATTKTEADGTPAALPPLTPEHSITSVLGVVKSLTPLDSGSFFNYDGSILPW